jgi:biopolymer transport protein TolR
MNITSLADVAINLMIIFLIAGISVALTRAGISISLPKSQVADIQKAEGITLTITKNKEILIEDRRVTINELHKELAQLQSQKGVFRVYLIADREVDYGTIIKVLAKTKEGGIENVGLVVSPEIPKKTP